MAKDYSDRFGYVPAIPEEFRLIFMWLCQDVSHVYLLWKFYLELANNEDYEKVFDLVPASFGIIESALRSDITMSICRLSDPPQSRGQNNLSIPFIARHCSDISVLDRLVHYFSTACEPVRKLRHKNVGHSDLNTRIDPHNNPLPGIGRDNIDEIIRLAIEILNTVLGHYTDAELGFIPIQYGGADDLIHWLNSVNHRLR